MLQKTSAILLSVLFFILLACSSNKQAVIEKFNQQTERIQKKWAPDLAIQVFSARLINQNGRWQLKAESTVAQALDAVTHLTDSVLDGRHYQKQVRLLPDSALGDSAFAVVKIAVANVRRRPKHAAELIDQAIMGNALRLLKREKSWYLIQMPYGYIGWMTKCSFWRTDEKGYKNWKHAPLLRITSLMDFVHKQPSINADAIANVVLNSRLRLIKAGRKWTRVALPGGKEGFVLQAHAALPQADQIVKVSGAAIVQTARRMLGIPYLWGGKSAEANDCSGFTQTVFKANGIQLPRDARQQVLNGKEVPPNADFSNVKAGDLLFFGIGKRITHVGISLGGYDFIHQDSDVHIDSFDEKATNFNAFRKKTLKKIKRILN